MKTLPQNFADWESTLFGFGYGTGEQHIIPAIKAFFDAVPVIGAYDYQQLEGLLTPTVAWLLINAFGNAGIIEYGTSPRFGWLTETGKALQGFIVLHGADELITFCQRTEDNIVCYPDACNCGPDGYEEGRVCGNVFWGQAAKAKAA